MHPNRTTTVPNHRQSKSPISLSLVLRIRLTTVSLFTLCDTTNWISQVCPSIAIVGDMSQDVTMFSCLKLTYLQQLIAFCCFYDVIVQQYRQGDSLSSTEFPLLRWIFEVIVHRLLTWCVLVVVARCDRMFTILLPSFQYSGVVLSSFRVVNIFIFTNIFIYLKLTILQVLLKWSFT